MSHPRGQIAVQCNVAKCSNAGVNTVLVGAPAKEQVVLLLELKNVFKKMYIELDCERENGGDLSDVIDRNVFLAEGTKYSNTWSPMMIKSIKFVFILFISR